MFAPACSIVQLMDVENFVGVETNKYMHTIIPGCGGAPTSALSVIRIRSKSSFPNCHHDYRLGQLIVARRNLLVSYWTLPGSYHYLSSLSLISTIFYFLDSRDLVRFLRGLPGRERPQRGSPRVWDDPLGTPRALCQESP